MKPTTLRLLCLETRLAPAVATWDGGGADNHWTTAANWVGDVAPNPGDDLVFPETAQQLTNVNDLPAGTAFGSLQISGVNYQLSGNAIALAGGIIFLPPAAAAGMPTVGLPITLTADQTFHGGAVYSGPLNLNGHALTLTANGTLAGDISGAGSVNFSQSSDVVSGHDTYTGPTVISGAFVTVNGSIAGPVTLQSGFLNGSGSVGDVTVTAGLLGQLVGAIPQTPSTLTTGGLTLSDRTTVSFDLSASGSDRIAAVGSVHLAGILQLPPDTTFRPVAGQQFTIIDNDGTDPVVGTFSAVPDFPGSTQSTYSDAPEGAIVMRRRFGNFGLRISYKGGDGNDVTLTTVALPAFAVGAGAGGLPVVNLYDANGALVRSFLAYESTFHGGVHVVTADVTGDGVPDTITAPGVGGGPLIRIWDGQTGAMVKQFLAYDAAFRGGVNIAAANISHFVGQGLPDIITGAGPGGGPHVKVFDVQTLNTVRSFFAFDPAFLGGVTVAASDSIATGVTLGFKFTDRIIVGAGPGGVPLVRVFDDNTNPVGTFLAYDAGFRGGVNVAWDGFSIETSPGAGSPPLVKVFTLDGYLNRQFLAFDARFLGGVTVAAHGGELATGAGPGGVPIVREWTTSDTVTGSSSTLIREFFAFDPAFTGGVFVG
jgi:hypothetical protein